MQAKQQQENTGVNTTLTYQSASSTVLLLQQAIAPFGLSGHKLSQHNWCSGCRNVTGLSIQHSTCFPATYQSIAPLSIQNTVYTNTSSGQYRKEWYCICVSTHSTYHKILASASRILYTLIAVVRTIIDARKVKWYWSESAQHTYLQTTGSELYSGTTQNPELGCPSKKQWSRATVPCT
jgi:hypothetical protein